MTKRKGDQTPPPSGGRAAERLRQFEEARGIRRKRPAEDKAEPGCEPSRNDETPPESSEKNEK
jgi:hypothetical protein